MSNEHLAGGVVIAGSPLPPSDGGGSSILGGFFVDGGHGNVGWEHESQANAAGNAMDATTMDRSSAALVLEAMKIAS